jgi:hypothetical protein
LYIRVKLSVPVVTKSSKISSKGFGYICSTFPPGLDESVPGGFFILILDEGGKRLQGYYWTLKSGWEGLCYILWIVRADYCISGFWL